MAVAPFVILRNPTMRRGLCGQGRNAVHIMQEPPPLLAQPYYLVLQPVNLTKGFDSLAAGNALLMRDA